MRVGYRKRLKQLVPGRKLARRQVLYGSLIIVILFVSSLRLLNLSPYKASTGQLQYFRARVVKIEGVASSYGASQRLSARLLDGPDAGRAVTVPRNVNLGDASYKRLPLGSQVFLTKDPTNGNQYMFGDRWHMPGVATIFLILLVLVVIIGGWRGITSIFGLVISIGVISTYVLPQILNGHSAYAACLQGALIITVISLYIAHGFNKRTTVAFVSSLVTLFAVVSLVQFATYLTGTSEVVDESTSPVLYSAHPISLAGLLSGGIIIASLGVLYDITTGQAAAVDEIYKANKRQSLSQLYRKGLSVGREHIAALINTLALVYVGVALPSIVITSLYNPSPLLVIFNSETVVEEVVRTSVASIGMLLAVPITSMLAAYFLPKWYSR